MIFEHDASAVYLASAGINREKGATAKRVLLHPRRFT